MHLAKAVALSFLGIAAASCTDSGPTIVTNIAVVPESVTVEPGEQRLIVTAALDPTGAQVVGAVVSFTSSDTSIATVSTGGLVTGRKSGRANAVAKALDVVRNVPVIVPNATMSIVVQPDSVAVNEGDTQLLTAVALDVLGHQITNTTVTFTTADTAIATVTSGGLVRGKRRGHTTATASRGAISRTVPVTVNPSYRPNVITPVPLPSATFALAVSPTGIAYVGRDDAKLTRFDVAHYSVTGELTAAAPPVDITFDAAGTKAYLTNNGATSFSVVDVAAATVGPPVNLPGQPLRVRVSPDGARLYITLMYGAVTIIDRTTLVIDTTIALDVTPNGIAFDPTRPAMYVSTVSGFVSEINTTTKQTTRKLTIGGSPQDIVVSPDGTELYIANESRNRIDVWSISTDNAVTTIQLADQPFGMIASPDGALLFVTLPSLGQVAVIDPRLRQVVRTITTGGTPRRLGIDGAGNTLVIANQEAWVDFVH